MLLQTAYFLILPVPYILFKFESLKNKCSVLSLFLLSLLDLFTIIQHTAALFIIESRENFCY